MENIRVKFNTNFGLFVARLDPANKIIQQDANFIIIEMPNDNWAKLLMRIGGDLAQSGGDSPEPTPVGPTLDYTGYTLSINKFENIPMLNSSYTYAPYVEFDVTFRNMSEVQSEMFKYKTAFGLYESYAYNNTISYIASSAGGVVAYNNFYNTSLIEKINDYGLICCAFTSKHISFPNCTYLGAQALNSACLNYGEYLKGNTIGMFNLGVDISLPKCSYVGSGAFEIVAPKDIWLNACQEVAPGAFNFYLLQSDIVGYDAEPIETNLYLLNSEVVSCSGDPIAIENLSVAGSLFHINVPASLVDTYKADATWGSYSEFIRAYIGG